MASRDLGLSASKTVSLVNLFSLQVCSFQYFIKAKENGLSSKGLWNWTEKQSSVQQEAPVTVHLALDNQQERLLSPTS